MVFLYAHKFSWACCAPPVFSYSEADCFLSRSLPLCLSLSLLPCSFPGGLMDCVFLVCEKWAKTDRQAEGNGWIISCHFSLHQMNWIDPVGWRQFPHCCRIFKHNLFRSFLFASCFFVFLLQSLFCSLCSVASDRSACCYIITNAQIMSPPSLLSSLNNLSKTSWVTFASARCQRRFPPSLLKKLWEEAVRS